MKTLKLFRLIGGQKVPWVFELDDTNTIINEHPDHTPPEKQRTPKINGKNNLPLSKPAGNRQKRNFKELMASRGIPFEETNDGKFLIGELPEKERKILQFLTLTEDCPSGMGWEELRNKYKEELERAGGKACPGCTRNRIQSKFRELLSKHL